MAPRPVPKPSLPPSTVPPGTSMASAAKKKLATKAKKVPPQIRPMYQVPGKGLSKR